MCKQFENILVQHCSPAIFGLKASNLISVSLDKCPNIENEIIKLNEMFNNRISFRILSKTNSSILVLVYKEAKLCRTIFNESNYEYLLNYSYPIEKNLDKYLIHLEKRLANSEFPHEIGVFLGYSLDDIMEYQNGNKNCLYVGYWKVFKDKEKKLKIFNQFTKCKNTVLSLVNKGYNLESII